MSDLSQYSEGVRKYVAKGQEIMAQEAAFRKRMKGCKFDTIAVHGSYSAKEALENNQGAIIEPIYMATSQAYRDSDEMEAALAYLIPTWCYSRIANPSMYYLERQLAMLEGYGTDYETFCVATSSGMSAIMSATLPFLVATGKDDAKMNIVSSCMVYGGTFQLFAIRYAEERGIELRWVTDPGNLDEWEEKIDNNTRFVYGEAPSNPQQAFFDIEAIAKLAHKVEAPLIVDATCATPALCRPLAFGADIVVHSVTKSMTCSGFGVAGAVISKNDICTRIDNTLLRENFASYVKFLPYRDQGPCISPMNSILTLNDMRTIRSKMDMFSRNCLQVAKFLEGHKAIAKVEYLGLESHPLHKLASKYMHLVDSENGAGQPENRYGHLMAFHVDGSPKDTRNFFDKLEQIYRATDLGRIKSVATIPAISTHQQQGEEGRKLAGIPPQLVRLCVGGECADDVIADLDQALSIVKK